PDVRVEEHRVRLTKENAESIVQAYDIVADCTDNFAARYLINDVCVKLKKPLSHGAIYKFEGQLITIIPGQSPCYRCIFPEPAQIEDLPSPAGAGLLGVVPGVIGVLQANEILKYLLGVGELLQGRLLIFNALRASFRSLKVSTRKNCPACASS
ncbi:ThiF family adenylyltransferase, partial [Candidatus Margulisiibacteriota bacterium]